MMTRLTLFVLGILMVIGVALAQDATPESQLTLEVGPVRCPLVLVEIDPETTPEPEVTPEPAAPVLPDYPVLVPADDCARLPHFLYIPTNDTRYMRLIPADDSATLELAALEDDPYPPIIDRDYLGCHMADLGEQTCYALVTLDDATYVLAIPVVIGEAYIAPTATDMPTATSTAIPTNTPTPVPPAANDSASDKTSSDSGGGSSTKPQKPTATPTTISATAHP
jgi:hypothetical protein